MIQHDMADFMSKGEVEAPVGGSFKGIPNPAPVNLHQVDVVVTAVVGNSFIFVGQPEKAIEKRYNLGFLHFPYQFGTVQWPVAVFNSKQTDEYF
jgi:hypothetical protein